MSDDKEQSPSASDIVDNMAEEMGVDDEEASDKDVSDDMMDELGGLFGVSSDGDGDKEADEAPTAEREQQSAEIAEKEAEAADGEDSDDEPVADGGEDESDADEMSPDLARALAESDDLDDETRKKIEGILAEASESSDGGDEEDEESVEAEADTDDETAEEESESEEEAEPEEEADAETEDEEDEQETEATDEADEADETDETDEQEADKEQEGSSSSGGAVGGVFDPSGSGGDGDGEAGDAYLDEEDLGDYESEGTNSTVLIMGGAIVLLLGVFIWILLAYTEQGERIVHLFKGDLAEYEMAQAEKKEEQFEKEQLKKLPKFGTLSLNGKPKYATVKLDGELQFGQTPKSKEWREVRLTPKTQFKNLDVKKQHKVTVDAPGFQPKTWKISKGMWEPIGQSKIEFQKMLNVNLLPTSSAKQIEFQQRLEKDPDNNYFGKVSINTIPSGAKIIFDGKPLLDEEGEELKTPVEFEKAYYKNEESGEIEEKKIKVDMPLDRGHKIQLRMPEEKGDYPKYVTPLERQMWNCEWKDGEKPEEPPYPKACEYSYKLELDFDGLKKYIKERKERIKEIKAKNKKLKKELAEQAKKAKQE